MLNLGTTGDSVKMIVFTRIIRSAAGDVVERVVAGGVIRDGGRRYPVQRHSPIIIARGVVDDGVTVRPPLVKNSYRIARQGVIDDQTCVCFVKTYSRAEAADNAIADLDIPSASGVDANAALSRPCNRMALAVKNNVVSP